jgi:serine/threonine-protein kinase RsbT
MENERRVAISSAADIVIARQEGRALAMAIGFDGSDLTLIATAISEVARNIVDHAERGEIVLETIQQGDKHGVLIAIKARVS